MKKFSVMAGMLLIVGLFTACSSNNNENNLEDELTELNVDSEVPETADPKENVHLEALVTYEGEPVEEAEEGLFEIWESGNKDDSEKREDDNEGEGGYTLDYQFDEEGVYEMYAHTTAEGLHTMTKKQIAVEMQKYLTMKMTKMKTMNMENITCKAQEEWPVNTKNFCIYLRRNIFIFKNIRVVWSESGRLLVG